MLVHHTSHQKYIPLGTVARLFRIIGYDWLQMLVKLTVSHSSGDISFRHDLPLWDSQGSVSWPDFQKIIQNEPNHQHILFMLYTCSKHIVWLGYITVSHIIGYNWLQMLMKLTVRNASHGTGFPHNLPLWASQGSVTCPNFQKIIQNE